MSQRITRQSKKIESVRHKIMRIAGLTVDDEAVVSKILLSILERCSKQLPTDVSQRLLPFYTLHTNTIVVDDCNFTNSIKSIKVLTSDEKSSASTSWIIFGKIENFDVSLKLSLLSTESEKLLNENSLEIERLIYRKVINPLMICGFTPHVVAYYGELFCDSFVQTLNEKIKQGDESMLTLAKELQKSYEVNPNKNPMPPPFIEQDDTRKPKYDINKMRALISEKVIGSQFENVLKQHPLRASKPAQQNIFNQIYLPILFQVFYTLAAFAEVGLVHNDLHAGNVFVAKHNTSVQNCYLIGGNLYFIDTPYQSRIFDFDRGAKLPTAFDNTELRNTLLSRSRYCDNFGQCQNVDERRELFTFCYFCYAYNKHQNIYLDNLLEKIVPIDLLVRPSSEKIKDEEITPGKTLAWSGRLCACKDRRCQECTVINDPRILTPKQIVALPEFNRFRIEASKVGAAFVWTLPSEAINNPQERFQNAAK